MTVHIKKIMEKEGVQKNNNAESLVSVERSRRKMTRVSMTLMTIICVNPIIFRANS